MSAMGGWITERPSDDDKFIEAVPARSDPWHGVDIFWESFGAVLETTPQDVVPIHRPTLRGRVQKMCYVYSFNNIADIYSVVASTTMHVSGRSNKIPGYT